ncbi:MAG: hypothetical protein IJ287_01955 [Methanobrevibacter sp.]|nr:hypothetical protein [Methanobrevibacter sp.]
MSYKVLRKNSPEEKYRNELKRAISRFLHSRQANGDETNARYISQISWEIYEEDRMCDEAIILIDSAIKLHPTGDYYIRKATFIRYKLEISVIVRSITSHDLDLINDALRILPQDCDHGPYLKVKADILNLLGNPVKAKICNALAYEDYDKVDIAEKQLEKLKKHETYINITGIHYYQGFEPFSEGTVVDLISELNNPHDRDAIRVEINGER